MGLTAVGITVAGIYFHQNFLRILPLYNSLVIGMLQSRVNRYSSMLGSINSIIYGFVYIYYDLMGSAISAFLFSFPVQLMTFVRWNRNKWEHSTVLRKMNTKTRILLSAGFVGLMVALWYLLPLIGAKYVFLDSATSLLGIVILFLTMFAFVEYTFLMIINGIIGIVLYIQVMIDSPETAPFLIFSVYSFVCVVFGTFEASRLYKAQQKDQ